MSDQETIRKNVSDAYAKAVTDPSESCCCQEPVQKGVAVKLAGYSSEELAALPPEAVTNSFGCGNPLAFSEVQSGEVVLDLGSGAGIDLLIAGKKVGPSGKALGIDMTDEMIAKANDNIAAAGLNNVEVRKGIIEDLPVDTGSVDWVISNCVINLSPEKPRVFNEIARVLKPGGRVAVSDIVVTEIPDWVRTNKALYCSCVAGAISEEDYVHGLRQAGLEDVQVVERIVYDALQLKGFIESELNEDPEKFSCCSGAPANEQIDSMIAGMEGKVWSAKFEARKPDA